MLSYVCENTKWTSWIVDEVIKLLNQLDRQKDYTKNFESFLRAICKPEVKTVKGKVIRDYHFDELPDNPCCGICAGSLRRCG